MEYARLGNSGLKVSRIALGCMSFGDTSRGFSQWSLGDEESRPFFEQAVEFHGMVGQLLQPEKAQRRL
jgi:aryl-alcohol dehydrogenase-like predicted oxidoreductase